MGNRSVGSNIRVLVPTQRHLPLLGPLLGVGSSFTGTSSAASASSEVTGTIGCENVTLRWGASGTSPSGAKRTTSSGPLGLGVAPAFSGLGGKAPSTVAPVRG